jgi:hypothetical protein
MWVRRSVTALVIAATCLGVFSACARKGDADTARTATAARVMDAILREADRVCARGSSQARRLYAAHQPRRSNESSDRYWRRAGRDEILAYVALVSDVVSRLDALAGRRGTGPALRRYVEAADRQLQADRRLVPLTDAGDDAPLAFLLVRREQLATQAREAARSAGLRRCAALPWAKSQ